MNLCARRLIILFLGAVASSLVHAQSPWVALGSDTGTTLNLQAQGGTVAWATTHRTHVYSSGGELRYSLQGQRNILLTADGHLIDCIKAEGDNTRFIVTKRDATGAAVWSTPYDFPAARVVSGSSCEFSMVLADGSYMATLSLRVYTKEIESIRRVIKLSATGSLVSSPPGLSIGWFAYALPDGGVLPGPRQFLPLDVLNADLSTRFTAPNFAWQALAVYPDSSILLSAATILPTGFDAHLRRLSSQGITLWETPLGAAPSPINTGDQLSYLIVNQLSSVSNQVVDSREGFSVTQRDELGAVLRKVKARGFNLRGGFARTGPFRFIVTGSPINDIANGIVQANPEFLEFFESDGTTVQRSSPPLPLPSDRAIAFDQGTFFASTYSAVFASPSTVFMRALAERTKLRLVAPIDLTEVDAGATFVARAEGDISDPLAPLQLSVGSSTCNTTVGVAECTLTAPNSIGPAQVRAFYAGSNQRESALTPASVVKVRGASDLAIRIFGLPRFFPVAASSTNAFAPINFTVEVRELTGTDVQTTVRIRAPWWRGFARPNVTCPANLVCQRVGVLTSGDVYEFAVRLPANSTTLFRVDALVPPYELGIEAPVQTTEATIILDSVHTDPQLTNNAAQVITSLGIFASGFD